MKNNDKLLLHSLFSIIARFIGVGLNFSLRILMTRTLARPEAGVLFLLMTFIPGVSLLSRIGLEQLLIKEVASSKAEDISYRSAFLKNSYVLTFICSVIMTLLWLVTAPYLQQQFFHHEISLSNLRWAGVSLFFFSLLTINSFYLKAIKRTILSVLIQNALPASCFLLIVFLFWNDFRQEQHFIQLYIASLVIAGIASLLLTWGYFEKRVSQLPNNVPNLMTMARQSFPLAPVSYFSFFMLWADTLMVGYFLNTAQVALFNTAATVSFVSLFFLGALDSTIYPRLLNIAKQESAKLKAFFWQATLLVIFVLLSVTVLMAAFSAPILSVFKEEYIAAQSSLTILLLAQFLRATSLTFSFMFIIREKVRYLNIILVLSLIINFISNVILIKIYGMEGAAIATLIANGFLAFSVMITFFYQKLLIPEAVSSLRHSE